MWYLKIPSLVPGIESQIVLFGKALSSILIQYYFMLKAFLENTTQNP